VNKKAAKKTSIFWGLGKAVGKFPSYQKFFGSFLQKRTAFLLHRY
jgi:hypothetical protein